MRKLFLSLLTSLMMLAWTNSYAQSNYQEEIKAGYREALMTKEGTTSLKETQQHLARLLAQDRFSSELKYWLAYDEYYTAKYYELRGNKARAESLLARAIKRLETIQEKSAEDYALLSFLQTNYIKYTSLGRVSLAKKMASNCQKALELEPKNLRANVVWGIIDLARPKAFGGGKEGEDFLLDAIETLAEQEIESEELPSWGKEEAYEALIRYYIKVRRRTEALEYIEEFEELYPLNLHIDTLKALLRKSR